MAAASTFTNLIPILTVNDSRVVAGLEFDLTVGQSVSGGTTFPLGSHTYTDGTVVTVPRHLPPVTCLAAERARGTGVPGDDGRRKAVTANFTLVTHTLVVAVSPASGAPVGSRNLYLRLWDRCQRHSHTRRWLRFQRLERLHRHRRAR